MRAEIKHEKWSKGLKRFAQSRPEGIGMRLNIKWMTLQLQDARSSSSVYGGVHVRNSIDWQQGKEGEEEEAFLLHRPLAH